MGIESGPSGHRHVESVELPLGDSVIKAVILDQESSRTLLESDAVLWLRGAIAVDTKREPSEILDNELFRRYINGGKFEWDPLVAKAVRSHLASMGFFYSS